MSRRLIAIGALLAGLAVILGAFGAHALKPDLIANSRLDTYQTAVDYHFIHALALILAGILRYNGILKSTVIIAWLFGLGLILFSGSLYFLAVFNMPMLGIITPFGGVFFICGWILMSIKLLKK